MEIIGPKRVCQLVLLPSAAIMILLAFPPNLILLYLARFSLGLLMGAANTVVLPIATELCEPAFRGVLSGKFKIIIIIELYNYT